MKIQLDEGAIMPTRAHGTDAGLDLYAKESKWIPGGFAEIFDTGVHIELPPGTVGMIKSRSGLNIMHDLVCEGVVDVGYTGSIRVKLFKHGAHGYHVRKGDKIAQLVIMPILTPELELVDSLEETERGDNGFGSSGR